MTAENTTLTAVPGFQVGHWTDPVGQTGCTVILCPPEGAVASASRAFSVATARVSSAARGSLCSA